MGKICRDCGKETRYKRLVRKKVGDKLTYDNWCVACKHEKVGRDKLKQAIENRRLEKEAARILRNRRRWRNDKRRKKKEKDTLMGREVTMASVDDLEAMANG